MYWEEIINILSPNVLNTDKICLQVGKIRIMGLMEKYFIYCMHCMGCGISEIILDGTIEYQEKILEKVNKLRNCYLNWWIDEIEPILKKLISTKKREIGGNFWIIFIYNEDRFMKN